MSDASENIVHKNKLGIEDIRARLSEKNGREYWRSLDDIAETEEFKNLLEKEFPRETSAWSEGYNRRDFLKVMGASLSLAGLTACVKQPEEKIVPYVKAPELVVPGKPLYYATAFVMEGYATGVLARSNEGRPTGIEGNPDHPASLGAADIFATASLLNLYDPDRSQVVLRNNSVSSWENFVQAARLQLEVQRSLRGAGLRILTPNITSPTIGAQLQAILSEFPQAKWHQHEPCGTDNSREGTKAVFGEYLHPRYKFDKADVVLSLDGDIFASGPAHLRQARDFTDRRRVLGKHADMNRLYLAESSPTVAATMADHRFRMKASEVEAFARNIAAELGVAGVTKANSPVDAKTISAIVKDLQRHRGASIIFPGNYQSESVHALAHAMNAALGNIGATVEYTQPVEVQAVNHSQSLKELADDITKGSVDMLLIFGCNPVYNAPADMKFGDLISKVAFTVHLATHEDETSLKCLWHVPESHYLEAWGDARAFDGTATIMQPLILPLYATRSLHEVLDSMFASGRDGEEIVKSYWQKKAGVPDFNSWWRKSLNDGVVAGTAFSPKQVAASNVNWKFSSPASQGMEIIFRPDQSIHDGRFSNNPWLQELPKHISRVAWDNIALVSPSSAQKLGLELGDMMELTISGRSEKFPAWIMPGHPDESVTVYFGYGRTKAGKVGTGIGANAFALRSSDTMYFASGLQIKKTGKQMELASTQDHGSMEGRPIVREASVTEFNANPDFAQHMAHKPNQEQSFYPEYKYDGYKWAMTIDLNACVGCNACMIACVSENNIPVVGKSQVDNGREMHWIRVDRYYVGNDLDNPELVVMPVTCQHCENAPCEPVCPVLATQHDHEGLNVMTYNRCVGTRYCGDNCPYKVRRFNFLQYSDTTTKTFQLMRNPDVTVRNRGVMEKCSYCLQRISAARIEAKKDDRMIRDGEVVTACQSACPTQAIWFGDMNDKTSKIAELKADPRAYGLLEDLNTKPRTSYLAKLRNPNPELVSENQANKPTHHG